MTDSSSSLHSHTALAAQPVVDYAPSSIEHNASSKSAQVAEELDYTIKCLCGLTIEEQNTICCERCETWQHTECYYIDENGAIPSNEDLENIEHFCVDCEPRPVDRKGATERQRARLESIELHERKRPKPPSKSHKKKPKAVETNGGLTNGYAHGHDPDSAHDRTSRSPLNNAPPGKRTKTGHRSSHSTNLPSSSQHATSHKRSASAFQSPTKVPLKPAQYGTDRELCSSTFVHLYDNDPGDSDLQTNLFSDIQITNDLKRWSNDLDALHEAAPTYPHTQIFQRTQQPISSMQMAELHRQERVSDGMLVHGQHPKWRYLTVGSWTQEGSLVAEIKGKIGHMREYTEDPDNRWDYLRHPEPFVFFHRHLPIYIDTRSEGTTCRYLRRSCVPNLEMKTFLENDFEYHFCFVATKDIEPHSELTIGWTTDEHMRRILTDLENGIKEEELGAEHVEYMADWSSKVLLEFGGCACDGSNCAMTKRSKRANGSKPRNGYSSVATVGYRIGSRDGSDRDDSRSTSESKTGSRDMTPTDAFAESGFGTEISAREKRKIAALDKKFEQLEEKPVVKKKKRNSGGSSVNTPSADTSKRLGHPSFSQPNTPGLSYKPQYADASTSGRKSGSPTGKPSNNPLGRPRSSTATRGKQRSSVPNTPQIPSPLFRANYISQGMQTDPVEEEEGWSKPSHLPFPPRKPYISLTKRLLLRSQNERQMLEQRRSASIEPPREQSTDALDPHPGPINAGVSKTEDTDMEDAYPSSSPKIPATPSAGLANLHLQEQSSNGEGVKPLPPVWPLQDSAAAQSGEQPVLANGVPASDLHIDLSKSSDPVPGTPTSDMPTTTIPPQSPITQPLSHPVPPLPIPPSNTITLIQPSPITKKLSLKEYFNKRKSSSNAGDNNNPKSTGSPEMTQGAFKPPPPPSLVNGDSNSNSKASVSSSVTGPMEGSAIVDSPKEQKSGDPMETVLEEGREEGGGS